MFSAIRNGGGKWRRVLAEPAFHSLVGAQAFLSVGVAGIQLDAEAFEARPDPQRVDK